MNEDRTGGRERERRGKSEGEIGREYIHTSKKGREPVMPHLPLAISKVKPILRRDATRCHTSNRSTRPTITQPDVMSMVHLVVVANFLHVAAEADLLLAYLITLDIACSCFIDLVCFVF
mgnify:CR=1 FL=1